MPNTFSHVIPSVLPTPHEEVKTRFIHVPMAQVNRLRHTKVKAICLKLHQRRYWVANRRCETWTSLPPPCSIWSQKKGQSSPAEWAAMARLTCGCARFPHLQPHLDATWQPHIHSSPRSWLTHPIIPELTHTLEDGKWEPENLEKLSLPQEALN